MERICLACGLRPADTTPEYPALCQSCLDRAGDGITPGTRVICTEIDEGHGEVLRLEADGTVVVLDAIGVEIWLPIANLVTVR